MLRGAFGNVLHWLGREYTDERSMENQIYLDLYEKVYKNERHGKQKPHMPGDFNPYFFECEMFESRKYQAGDTFSFSATFMGNFANRHIESIVTAIKLMIEGDLCGNIDCFVLESATDELKGGIYYSNGNYANKMPEAYHWSDQGDIPVTVSALSITFDKEAPLMVTTKSPSMDVHLPFTDFLHRVLQRVENICVDFSNGEQIITEWEGMMARSSAISYKEVYGSAAPFSILQIGRSKSGELRWIVSGKIIYTGDLTEYMPYIDAGSVLHIGKSSSLAGTGRYEWRIIR